MESTDVWFTARGEENGNTLIFRGRHNIPDGIDRTDYPILLSIFWPYQPDGDSGMPDEETNDSQIELEDALEDLDVCGSGFLMLVVTGNGRKEWHWYIADLESCMQNLNEELSGHGPFPIEIEHRSQPDWDLYRDFIKGLT